MLGKWDKWYKGQEKMGSFKYGNTKTYDLAAQFLEGLEVEDWGCGMGGYRRVHKGDYIGVDGSWTPFVNKIRDLTKYHSNPEGIMMRHVLEHNYEWKKVLLNAVASFQKRMVLVLFTPFSEETHEIAHNLKHGVDVPDISFNPKDIEQFFSQLKWTKETLQTRTGYGQEHIYSLERHSS